MVIDLLLQVRLCDKANQNSKDVEGNLSKIEEIDGEEDKCVTRCVPWVHEIYSQFDVLKELSFKILDNIKYGRGNLFHTSFWNNDIEDEFGLSCTIVEGLAYCGQSWGGGEWRQRQQIL